MIRVACQQLAPRLGDLDGNRRLSVEAIVRAGDAGADLVVLPELVTSGYLFDSRDEARAVAIPPDHPILAEWAAAAAGTGCVVVSGFCEDGRDGNLYNSAAVVSGTGVVAVYRKTHLWGREKLVFTPGREGPPVVEVNGARVGVLICYDLEFPEMPRSLALAGADVIVVPSNWPLRDRPPGEHPAEVIIAMATAQVNRVFIACCDRAGVERGQEWTEGTAIIDRSGWVLAAADDQGTAIADLDFSQARDKSVSPHNDVLADRRPDLYQQTSCRPATRE